MEELKNEFLFFLLSVLSGLVPSLMVWYLRTSFTDEQRKKISGIAEKVGVSLLAGLVIQYFLDPPEEFTVYSLIAGLLVVVASIMILVYSVEVLGEVDGS